MSGFSGQGRVMIGTRTPAGDPAGLVWVGNAPAFVVQLGEDVIERNESFSGSRLPLRRTTRAKQATLNIQADEWNSSNLARMLQSVKQSVAAGSAVTGEVQPTGLTVGQYMVTKARNISAVSVVDSTGSPKTLPPSQYELSAFGGHIKLLDLTAGGPYVQPFKVAYTPGARNELGLFTAAAPEYWVRFDGVNTDDNNTPCVVDLYRVRLSPIKELALINDEFWNGDVDGSVLVDTTKPSSAALGQFGAIYLPESV